MEICCGNTCVREKLIFPSCTAGPPDLVVQVVHNYPLAAMDKQLGQRGGILLLLLLLMLPNSARANPGQKSAGLAARKFAFWGNSA